MAVTSDITRYAGETYPNKSTIKINGVPVSIEDWRIEIRYKVPAGTLKPDREATFTEETEMVIDGVITEASAGKFNIYPYARVRYDANGNSTQVLGPNDFMPVEKYNKLVEIDIANGGNGSSVPKINQVWDDEEAGDGVEYPFYIVRIKSYEDPDCDSACFQEEQVHNVGKVKIMSKWLV